jgi:hypothetical protein
LLPAPPAIIPSPQPLRDRRYGPPETKRIAAN